MKTIFAVLVAVLAIALSSSRANGAAGINLSWNDCGSAGVQVRTFACNTNVGLHTMVGSFVAPAGVVAMSANEVIMDLQSAAPVLPAWWQVRTGLCRAGSLTGNWDFTGGPFSCYDYWQGGAIGAFAMDPPVGNRARIRAVFALPAGDSRITSIAEDTHVYSFKANLNSLKTTGAGACDGCEAGACIMFTQIKLNQPVPNPTFALTNPAERSYVSWQCPAAPILHDPGSCDFQGCPTPTHNRTWGQIKQLYR